MNASPHAHTYEGNKKETKRTNIYKYVCNIMKQLVIHPHKQEHLKPRKYTRPDYRQLHNITSLNINMIINIRIIIKILKKSTSSLPSSYESQHKTNPS